MGLTDNARVISEQEARSADEKTKEICTKGTEFCPVEACHDEGGDPSHGAGTLQGLDRKEEKRIDLKCQMRHQGKKISL